MAKANESHGDSTKIEVWLPKAELEILEKFRGTYSVGEFFRLVLQMIDSGAVSDVPHWARGKPSAGRKPRAKTKGKIDRP